MAKNFLTNQFENIGDRFNTFLKKYITLELLLIVSVISASIIVRIFALPYISGDYTTFLEKWYADFKRLGLDNAFGVKIADYFYPYLYLIGFTTLLPIKDLYAIKLISLVFDYLLAGLIYKMIRSIQPKHKFKAIIAGLTFLFLPTVISNGAVWAQCDVIFTFFAVLSLFLFIKKKNFWGTFAFAISFCFKLQAIFILPAIILFLFKKGKKSLWNLLLIPLTYLTLAFPAVVQGRSLIDVLTIYGTQATQYEGVNLGGYGFYSLFGGNDRFGELLYQFHSFSGDEVLFEISVNRMLGGIGTFSAFAIVALLFFSLVKYVKTLTPSLMINISLGFAFIIPYILPRMHERYWFVADVLSFIYAFLNPKRWYVAVIISLSSFIAYTGFLFQNLVSEIVPLKWLPIIAIVPIYFIFKDIYDEIKLQNTKK